MVIDANEHSAAFDGFAGQNALTKLAQKVMAAMRLPCGTGGAVFPGKPGMSHVVVQAD